jgi:hypothetical protein
MAGHPAFLYDRSIRLTELLGVAYVDPEDRYIRTRFLEPIYIF